MSILYFLLGVVFGAILVFYIIGTAIYKKFETKEEFEEWYSRIM